MLTLVRPDAGRLCIDGRDVDAALASRWRNQAAYVPQDVVLFDASIRDNLKLYVPEATDGELEAVLGNRRPSSSSSACRRSRYAGGPGRALAVRW